MKIVVLLLICVVIGSVGAHATEIIHPPGGGAPVEGSILPAVQGGTGVDGQQTWTDGRCLQVSTNADGKRILQTTAAACGTGAGSSSFSFLTSGTNTAASMIVGSGAYLAPNGTGTIIASQLQGTLPIAQGGAVGLSIESFGVPVLALNDLDVPDGGTADTALYTNCGAGPACQTALQHLVAGGVNGVILVAQPNGDVWLGDTTTTPQVVLGAAGTGTGDSKVVLPNNAVGTAELTSTITPAGSCTNCNLTYDVSGRLTAAANGVSFDSRLVNDTTWGNNTDAGIVWTFDPTGTLNPQINIANGAIDFGTGTSIFFRDNPVWLQDAVGNGVQFDPATATLSPSNTGIIVANSVACTGCVDLATEATGTVPIAQGGTNATSFTANRCVRFDGTRLVSAPADCGAGGGPTSTAATATPTATRTPTPTLTPSATLTPTPSPVATFNPALINDVTWGNNTDTSMEWTFNTSGTNDPTLTAQDKGLMIGATQSALLLFDDKDIANGASPDGKIDVACGAGPACDVALSHPVMDSVGDTLGANIIIGKADSTIEIGDVTYTGKVSIFSEFTGDSALVLPSQSVGVNELTHPVTAGTCKDCTVTYGADGRITSTVSGPHSYTRARYADSTHRTNTATLANDSGSGMNLVGFPVQAAAGLVYKIEAQLLVLSTATADFQVAIAGPASSCQLSATNLGNDAPTTPPNHTYSSNCTTTPTGMGVAIVSVDTILVTGVFVAASNGAVNLQWAQNTADPGATYLAPGSWMTVTEVREGDASFFEGLAKPADPDPWPPPPNPVPTPGAAPAAAGVTR